MVKKLSVVVVAVLAAGLGAAPASGAGKCSGGDPVYDPGSNDSCNFAVAPATSGAEARVWGRWFDQQPFIDPQYSYVKDTADDGLAAYVWVRWRSGTGSGEKVLGSASGLGATTAFRWQFAPAVDAFDVRVCVGEGTAACSDWRS
ncbi:hypothetical protein [Lentzea sp. NPDC059081]|uniref:hypothetical protein n=1 Tax=Lentzea sp. NPDC059081 TaxID=3346719 RepID=UPI003684C193